MAVLEAKIPPPAVALLVGLVMWGISHAAPLLNIPTRLRLIAAAMIVVMGALFSVAGVLSFRRARTTLNPTMPDAASTLVTSGIFRVTRNPMYIGLLLILVALAVFLSSGWALLGPVAFFLYIGRFQIQPEEIAMSRLFGSTYAEYRSKVRRWL
jgi:protein-S-isoprenylcysteine O-methyltransferase Ste14